MGHSRFGFLGGEIKSPPGHLIKDSQKNDNKKYTLMSILVYNLTIENKELKNFLYNSENYDFMTKLKYLDDYELSSTVNWLQDINNLYERKKNESNSNNFSKRM